MPSEVPCPMYAPMQEFTALVGGVQIKMLKGRLEQCEDGVDVCIDTTVTPWKPFAVIGGVKRYGVFEESGGQFCVRFDDCSGCSDGGKHPCEVNTHQQWNVSGQTQVSVDFRAVKQVFKTYFSLHKVWFWELISFVPPFDPSTKRIISGPVDQTTGDMIGLPDFYTVTGLDPIYTTIVLLYSGCKCDNGMPDFGSCCDEGSTYQNWFYHCGRQWYAAANSDRPLTSDYCGTVYTGEWRCQNNIWVPDFTNSGLSDCCDVCLKYVHCGAEYDVRELGGDCQAVVDINNSTHYGRFMCATLNGSPAGYYGKYWYFYPTETLPACPCPCEITPQSTVVVEIDGWLNYPDCYLGISNLIPPECFAIPTQYTCQMEGVSDPSCTVSGFTWRVTVPFAGCTIDNSPPNPPSSYHHVHVAVTLSCSTLYPCYGPPYTYPPWRLHVTMQLGKTSNYADGGETIFVGNKCLATGASQTVSVPDSLSCLLSGAARPIAATVRL